MHRRYKKLVIYVIAFLIIIIPSYFFVSGYIKSLPKLQYTFADATSQNIAYYPDAKFAVISDLHYYDNSLGTSGTAFESYLSSDRKLLKDSADLLSLAVDNLIRSRVRFVLVTGDITKDGELKCHQKAAYELSKLLQHGIKVYVIPGNHDVNNPRSFKYEGDKTISIPNITPSQFSDIYKNLGYFEALERDSNSLSYVAEPVDGLWLVALDTCRYRENKQGGEEIIPGKLSQGQEKWLEEVLKKAQKAKKAVMVMEHHGLVEHWNGQAKLHPDYLVEDYKYIGKLLASYGVRLAFTGHYHAQDIVMADFKSDGVIYDIETGSLITAPCPVRYLTISGNNLRVTTDNLVGKLHPGTDYEKNAEQFVYDSIKRETINILQKYFVPKKDADYIADHVAAAFCAHYRGDENAIDRPAFDESKLNFWSRFVYSREKYIIDGLWNDLPPEDNNAVIDLGKGVNAVH